MVCANSSAPQIQRRQAAYIIPTSLRVGHIVYLTEGPDGALYYVDLGFSDTTTTRGISKIRRIRFINGGDQRPIAVAAGR